MSLGVVSCFWLMCVKDICNFYIYIYMHGLKIWCTILACSSWNFWSGRLMAILKKIQGNPQKSPSFHFHVETYTFRNDTTLVEFEMCVHRSTLLYAHHGFYIVYLSIVSVSIYIYIQICPWYIFHKSDLKYLLPRFDTQKLHQFNVFFCVKFSPLSARKLTRVLRQLPPWQPPRSGWGRDLWVKETMRMVWIFGANLKQKHHAGNKKNFPVILGEHFRVRDDLFYC